MAPSASPSTTPFASHRPAGRTVYGAGCVDRLAGWLDRSPARRFLLVTDKGVAAAGIAARVRRAVGDRVVAEFDGVPQDSGLAVVDAAAALGRGQGVDGVLSVGGGSVLDTGKGVALALGLQSDVAALVGFRLPAGEELFHAAVPTTAGTGTEATDIVVLRDERSGLKAYIGDARAIPRLAVLDPLLTVSLPPAVTAATAMDALSHAIEAFVSRAANPAADAEALAAIRLVVAHLPAALADGGDLMARGALLSGAHRAGRALATARVGLVHALGHAVTARHGVPHGLVNGILLPHVVRWNAEAPETLPRYAALAVAAGWAAADTPHATAAATLAEGLAGLLASSGLPGSLAACGVPAEAVEECAALALVDVALRTNPRRPEGVEDLEALVRRALVQKGRGAR